MRSLIFFTSDLVATLHLTPDPETGYASASQQTLPISKVSTSDPLYFLRYRLPRVFTFDLLPSLTLTSTFKTGWASAFHNTLSNANFQLQITYCSRAIVCGKIVTKLTLYLLCSSRSVSHVPSVCVYLFICLYRLQSTRRCCYILSLCFYGAY